MITFKFELACIVKTFLEDDHLLPKVFFHNKELRAMNLHYYLTTDDKNLTDHWQPVLIIALYKHEK